MDSTTDVVEVDGVGSDTGSNLKESGFETIGDLADAEIDEIADVKGFGESRASDVIENAQGALDSDDDPSEDEGNEEVEDVEEIVEETVTNEADEDLYTDSGPFAVGDGPYPVGFELDRNVFRHVIHVVLEEATSQHQSSDWGLREDAYHLVDLLAEVLVETSGETVEGELYLGKDSLNAFYRSLSQGSLDYQSRSGITSMYGDLNQLKDTVNEQRREAISE